MKPPGCAAKEFFEIKESCPIENTCKRIKQISDAVCKKIDLTNIVMTLNYLMDK